MGHYESVFPPFIHRIVLTVIGFTDSLFFLYMRMPFFSPLGEMYLSICCFPRINWYIISHHVISSHVISGRMLRYSAPKVGTFSNIPQIVTGSMCKKSEQASSPREWKQRAMAIELKEMLGEITGISIRILGVMHLEIDLNLLLLSPLSLSLGKLRDWICHSIGYWGL
jgi:hypothetical protein